VSADNDLIEVTRTIPVTADRVFAVLADGWVYAGWVVGATHVRNVDGSWPAVGARIHHSLGPWPFVVHDVTTVVDAEKDRRLELDAGIWPMGTARVRLALTPLGNQTEVRMAERAVSGPLARVPRSAQAMVLRPRNREALRRLSDIAVNREQ